ncbi:MAG: hypothetical protein A3J24_13345 [Deltaproteobacteria bacterium RIFCSPLOWO2_02_FULL_53_8]|nr:MAG: hypothetical protein A3J24_13345 [Deltaproteobacteria bacterium RIFCSPLOWO2_02_FULL_53_8]
MLRAVKKSLFHPAKTFLPILCAAFILSLLISTPADAAAAVKRWAVNLTSYLVSEEAYHEAGNLKAAGYNAYVTEVTVRGKQYYRLRVGFFATKKEAAAQAALITKEFKTEDAWVVKASEAEAASHAIGTAKSEATRPAPAIPKTPPKSPALPQETAISPDKEQPAETLEQKEPVTETKPVTTAQESATEIKPVSPDADGSIHINIYKDFKYIAKGWAMGMSVGQTDAAGLTTVPFEVFKHEPAYASAKPLYGYFKLGNSNDSMVSFVVDNVEKPQWELYVDKNNNEDLTDDGPAIKNQGTLKMAATVTLEADVIMPDNESRKTPYQLWFFINASGPHFYATCHYAGKVRIGKDVFDATAFEEFYHDGLFKESGICVDINRDGKCSHEQEIFKDGRAITIGNEKYTFSLDYP